MIRYAVLDASGLVVAVGVAQSAALVAKAPSESVFEIDAQDPCKIEPDRYALQAGALVVTPEKTARHLVWSGSAWVDMRSQAEIDAAAELTLLSARMRRQRPPAACQTCPTAPAAIRRRTPL